MILLELYGTPVNWVHHQGTGNRAYDPKSKEKQAAKWQIRAQYTGYSLVCPVEVHMTFYMGVPKNTSAVKRRQMLAGRIKHIKRPDASNIYYFYENCLKGIVIDDDSQVYRFTAEKLYAEKEKVLIKIYPETDQGAFDAVS